MSRKYSHMTSRTVHPGIADVRQRRSENRLQRNTARSFVQGNMRKSQLI